MPSFGKSKTAGQNSAYRKGLKMNTSTKKSTKKHAEFLLYGGKDVHLQPKIVINNNNSTEMKISPFIYAIKETIKPDKSAL